MEFSVTVSDPVHIDGVTGDPVAARSVAQVEVSGEGGDVTVRVLTTPDTARMTIMLNGATLFEGHPDVD